MELTGCQRVSKCKVGKEENIGLESTSAGDKRTLRSARCLNIQVVACVFFKTVDAAAKSMDLTSS